ncbi:MAG: NAD(P)-dependent oxidoreductase, partial [Acidobacteria bacterium]|nr:NAD(P)-dependent oxidoreductase [Acidobacteriota bacterium]
TTPAQRLESLQTSVIGTAALAEAAAACQVQRFVFTSSFLAYRPQRRALVESDPLEPHSHRGAAKAAAAIWLRQFAVSQSFPAVKLRIFSIYGPGEPEHRFIPALLRAARHGTTLPLRPGPFHDFVHVDDVVDAALLAASTPLAPGSVFNIAGGQAFSNEQVVQAASQALGRPIHVNLHAYPPSPADSPFWLADISAAATTLGWKPHHTLESGLRQTEEESCLISA